MQDGRPQWRFAPTMGGAEQGANPGQQIFAPEALRTMVRETIQNSLDHHENGLPPVHVTYTVVDIPRDDIGADRLMDHLRACQEELGDDPQAAQQYAEMVQALQPASIPCLAVIDENTTGLQNSAWDNLIHREGVPTASTDITKGGSFGFGKNAPFNLAGAGAVIYSTRYLDAGTRKQPGKGRVNRAIGRAQLRTHTQGGARLQPIGFLAHHDEESRNWNRPLEGPEIPGPFRLQHAGTGVYITGFHTARHGDWEREITQAAATQFFAAIRWKKLTVRVGDHTVNHQTLDEEMQTLPEEHPARYYHLALTNRPRDTEPSGRMGGIGCLQAWVTTGGRAPRQLAHINRRGMLITESQDLEHNPLCPQRTGQWGPWAAVTMAADERTDALLRQMEPPAHDAIRPSQLREPHRRGDARRELEGQRRQLREFLRDELDQANRRSSTNVEELARLFPLTGKSRGRDLEFAPGELPEDRDQPIEVEGDKRERKSKPDGPTRTGAGPGPETPGRKVAASLRDTRILRTGSRDLIMAFTMPRDKKVVRYGLRAAGEQYQRNEKAIGVQEVVEAGDITASAHLEEGEIVVEALPDTRVNLIIRLEDDGEYLSYRLALSGEAE